MNHVLSSTVGTWDRPQFSVAPIAVHGENFPSPHFHELRERAIEIRGHPDILQGPPSRTAYAWPHQCAQANAAFISTGGNSDHTPASICALDKWKGRRLVPSAICLGFRLFLLGSRQIFCPGCNRGRIPAKAGIDFSVVYAGCEDLQKDFPRFQHGNRNVPVRELFLTTVSQSNHRFHGCPAIADIKAVLFGIPLAWAIHVVNFSSFFYLNNESCESSDR